MFIPAKIPLFPGEMAFEDILMDGKPALIENDNGYTTVTALKPGDHVVTAVFTPAGHAGQGTLSVKFQHT